MTSGKPGKESQAKGGCPLWPKGPRPSSVASRAARIRVRALLATLLNDAGHRTLEAANVDAALTLERQHAGPIHLLCTDAVMPGMPTRELIAQVRKRRPGIGVLVCSGYTEDEQISRGIRGGELQHLSKPFTRQALLAAVRAALEA